MGSSRMASRKVVLLLLLAATGHGQEIGDKSRFDQILSDFGFTGIVANPSKGVESPPSRQTVFNNEVLAEGKTSALSNLQAIASGQRGGHGLSDTFSRISPLSQPQPTRSQFPRRQRPSPRLVEKEMQKLPWLLFSRWRRVDLVQRVSHKLPRK